MDGDIAKAGASQCMYITLVHIGRTQRQLFGVFAQRFVDGRERRIPPVTRDGINEGISCFCAGESFDLGPEVMRVGLNSVFAVIGDTDHHGQHLALLPR